MMINFFEKGQKLFGLKELPTDVLLYRVMPHFFLEIVKKYLRMDVEGIENIPKKGAGIILPNHSGYTGFDAILIGYEINRQLKRTTRVMTHHLWFLNEKINIPANKLGFYEANKENGNKILKEGHLMTLFPEGEHGNFKPTSDAYQLQSFKRGFVRMALEHQVPIIPTVVIGAEETHINLKKLKFSKFLRGVVLPLPVNVIPLPAKWKIKFLEPIYLPHKPEAANDTHLVHEIATEVRDLMQGAINEELKKRDFIYIDGIY
jgi:1-acyl-sn-glycerol-3-phosphate acyltransferase